MEIEVALLWVQRLIAIAVILQSLELLLIGDSFKDSGVWSWPDLRQEFKIFSYFNQRMLDFFLSYKNFIVLIFVRLILGFCLLFNAHYLVHFALLFSTIMIALRWRGTFNGGSDYMTILVLSALTLSSLFSDSYKVSLAVLWYLAIQLCTSYFISGRVKLRRPNWRSGTALSGFMQTTIYKEDALSRYLLKHELLVKFFSWLIIGFELSFIVALFSPGLALIYISLAIAFHIGNFYIFGLNRFIFAWLPCYPALYFCSIL